MRRIALAGVLFIGIGLFTGCTQSDTPTGPSAIPAAVSDACTPTRFEVQVLDSNFNVLPSWPRNEIPWVFALPKGIDVDACASELDGAWYDWELQGINGSDPSFTWLTDAHGQTIKVKAITPAWVRISVTSTINGRVVPGEGYFYIQ
jgi:hypothetical protein